MSEDTGSERTGAKRKIKTADLTLKDLALAGPDVEIEFTPGEKAHLERVLGTPQTPSGASRQFPFAPLPSKLRTPEQMEWIHDRFKIDGLERLARSTEDYYQHKGYYLPDVAALAHAALTALDSIRQATGAALLISYNGETKMPRDDWLRIEAAILAAGIQTPEVAVVVTEEAEL